MADRLSTSFRIKYYLTTWRGGLTALLSGAILGIFGGFAAWILVHVPFTISLIACPLLGAVVVYAGYKLVQAERTRMVNPTRRKNGIVLAISLPIAVAVGTVVAERYKHSTPNVAGWRTDGVWLLTAILTMLVIVRFYQLRQERKASPQQLAVPQNNTYGGQWWLRRTLHLLKKNERRNDFYERPPPIQGIIECGLAFEIAAFSWWAIWRFPGLWRIINQVMHHPSIADLGYLMFVAVIITLGLVSVWEKRPTLRHRKVLEVLIALIFILLWGMLNFPAGRQLLHWIEPDKTRVWWLVAIPSTWWLLMRYLSYLGSFYQVTDGYLRSGSIGWFLEDDPVSEISRSQITKSTKERGIVGTLFRHWTVMLQSTSTESKEEEQSDVFQKMRVKHGPELVDVLAESSPLRKR